MKLNERFNAISKFTFASTVRLKSLPKGLRHTIYRKQKTIITFIKERRTIRLLHILRNYSALVVVVSSSLLVTSTNLAADGRSSGFLFGRWDSEEDFKPRENKINNQVSIKNNLTMVPLAKASTSPDPSLKAEDEENSVITDTQGQALVAASGPVMKDPQEDGGVKIYTVKDGDTISTIAEKHDITTNTILWANDIDNVDSIMPGDQIFILPVAGLKHIVKDGDTIDSISKEYKADKDKIIAFNDLPANGKIEKGEEIIIPGGQKDVPQRNTDTDSGIARRQYATPSGGTPTVSGWRKLEGKAGTGHAFPYGYCTWYVAQRRYIPWSGNAGAWLYNAKSMGYKTGKNPEKGAIVVTSESWWGHVGIVEKIGKGTITISEMNYKGWGKTSTRTISTKNRVIKGYIY